jgi:hypothetical protein
LRFNAPQHKLLLKAVSLEAVSGNYGYSLLVCCKRFTGKAALQKAIARAI